MVTRSTIHKQKRKFFALVFVSLYLLLLSLTFLKTMLKCLRISQIRYSLVVILELNGVSEVQYKDVMMIDDGKYQ